LGSIYLSDKHALLLSNIVTEYCSMMGDGEETVEFINEISDDLKEIQTKLRKSRSSKRSTKSDLDMIDKAYNIALKLKEEGKI
jgi:hypothetical protein